MIKALVTQIDKLIPDDICAPCDAEGIDYAAEIGPRIDECEDAMNAIAAELGVSTEQALLIVFTTLVQRGL